MVKSDKPLRGERLRNAIGRLSLQHRQMVSVLPANRWLTVAEVAYVMTPLVQRGVNVESVASYLGSRLEMLGLARRRWRDNRTVEYRISPSVHDAIKHRGAAPAPWLRDARRAASERGAGVGGSISGDDTGALLGGRAGD